MAPTAQLLRHPPARGSSKARSTPFVRNIRTTRGTRCFRRCHCWRWRCRSCSGARMRTPRSSRHRPSFSYWRSRCATFSNEAHGGRAPTSIAQSHVVGASRVSHPPFHACSSPGRRGPTAGRATALLSLGQRLPGRHTSPAAAAAAALADRHAQQHAAENGPLPVSLRCVHRRAASTLAEPVPDPSPPASH